MRAVVTSFFAIGVLSLASVPASAQTFLLTGAIDDGGAPASGILTFALELRDDDGSALWQETQANVVVIEGAFALDVGAAEPLPSAIPATATLTVIIEDDELDPLPLATLLRAARAARAPSADTSPTTRQLGTVGPDDVVTREALATAGGATVPVSGVADMPADVLDGDNGAVVSSAGTELDLEPDGTLALEALVSGVALAGNSVVQFGSGSIQSAKVAANAITGAKVAANALTRADLAADIGVSQVSTTRIFRVNTTSCSEPDDTLTTQATCAALLCDTGNVGPGGFPVFGRLSCSDGTCGGLNASTCANSDAGFLVAP